MISFRYVSTGGRNPQIRLAVEARLPELDYRGVAAYLRQLGRDFIVYYQDCWRNGYHPLKGRKQPSKAALRARRAWIYGHGGVVKPKLATRRGKNVIFGKLQPKSSYEVELDNPAYYASGLMAHSLRGYYRAARQYRNKAGEVVDVAARVEFGVDPSRTAAAQRAGLDDRTADFLAGRLTARPEVMAEANISVRWEGFVVAVARLTELVSAAADLVA